MMHIIFLSEFEPKIMFFVHLRQRMDIRGNFVSQKKYIFQNSFVMISSHSYHRKILKIILQVLIFLADRDLKKDQIEIIVKIQIT